MCVLPKAPKMPAVVERQAVQTPQEPTDERTSLNSRRRRGFWASIMTSPGGVLGAPKTTTLGT